MAISTAGDGGEITVLNGLAITTAGQFANAINAQSKGDGGGNGGDAFGVFYSKGGSGGKAGGVGGFADVDVAPTESDLSISTSGNTSHGLAAQSIGGGGGNGGYSVSVSGSVETASVSVSVGGSGGNGPAPASRTRATDSHSASIEKPVTIRSGWWQNRSAAAVVMAAPRSPDR